MRFIVALLLLLGLLLLAPGAYGRSGHREPTSRQMRYERYKAAPARVAVMPRPTPG